MTYNLDAKATYKTFVSGDYNNSIPQITDLLGQAPNKSEVGRLKIILAVSYWFRNQNDDRATSIKMLKSIVSDYTIPPVWRAQALNNIARFVQDSSISFYQLNFTEVPYNTYLPASGTDTQRIFVAYLSLLKYSDNTYPTSWAEYAIASFYAYLSSVNETGKLSQIDTAKLMVQLCA